MTPNPLCRLLPWIGCATTMLMLAGCVGGGGGGDSPLGGSAPVAPAAPGAPMGMVNPLPPDGVQVYSASAGVTSRPQPIRMARPIYPVEDRRAGVGGTVVVQFVVDEMGFTRNVTAVRAPSRGLAEACVAAVAHTRYRPGIVGGRPVRVLMEMPFTFSVDEAQ